MRRALIIQPKLIVQMSPALWPPFIQITASIIVNKTVENLYIGFYFHNSIFVVFYHFDTRNP